MFTHLIEEEEDCRALCNISLKSGDVEENSKGKKADSSKQKSHHGSAQTFIRIKCLDSASHDQFPSLITCKL